MLKKITCLSFYLANSFLLRAQPESFDVRLLLVNESKDVLPFVSNLRLTYFREYPYLYEGSIDEEKVYLDWLTKLPNSAVVVAYLKDEPVGFITGAPFCNYDEHFKGSIELFESAGLKPSSYYYVSEVIVVPKHRGKGLARKLFAAIEEYAKRLHFTACCFVTESYEAHPLKPENYRSLTPLWHKLGYEKSALSITYSWQTLQYDKSVTTQTHNLDYWLKDFNKNSRNSPTSSRAGELDSNNAVI